MEQVEELWSDIQAWERRMGEYCEDLGAIMLPLGIPLSPPLLGRRTGGGAPGSSAWAEHGRLPVPADAVAGAAAPD